MISKKRKRDNCLATRVDVVVLVVVLDDVDVVVLVAVLVDVVVVVLDDGDVLVTVKDAISSVFYF